MHGEDVHQMVALQWRAFKTGSNGGSNLSKMELRIGPLYWRNLRAEEFEHLGGVRRIGLTTFLIFHPGSHGNSCRFSCRFRLVFSRP